MTTDQNDTVHEFDHDMLGWVIRYRVSTLTATSGRA